MKLVLACLVLLSLTSCVIGLDSHSSQSGDYVSQESMRQIAAGKSSDFVLAILGEPTSKVTLEAGVEI